MSVIIDGSAGVTTNAGGSVNPSTTIDGINYSCRAWVNFTTAMTDTNFSTVGTTGSPAAAHGILMFFKGTVGTYPATTSSIQIATVTSNGGSTQFDYVNVCLAVFR